ncbi:MAG: hypothetical protein ACLT3D_09870 [Lawsonibacter sp.]
MSSSRAALTAAFASPAVLWQCHQSGRAADPEGGMPGHGLLIPHFQCTAPLGQQGGQCFKTIHISS